MKDLVHTHAQALAVYRKAVAQYHFAISDNLDWKGIRVEGLPDSAPPEREGKFFVSPAGRALALRGPDVVDVRADQAVVGRLLESVCRPAGVTRQREGRGEEIGRFGLLNLQASDLRAFLADRRGSGLGASSVMMTSTGGISRTVGSR